MKQLALLLFVSLGLSAQTTVINGWGGSGGTWGGITGTLSDQTDLQSALNAKQTTLTIGNFTEATSSILTISGGTGAIIGSGLSVQVKQSSGSQSGYLSSSDWTTFNNKLTSPLTTLGDILYGGAAGAATRLAGNTTSTKNFFCQTGTGTVSAAPSWCAIAGSDLPNPSSSTLGGIESLAAISHQWINTISTSGVPSATQPAFTDISGSIAANQLPNPSASTLGGIESIAAQSSKWINAISTSGVPSATQPAFTDISGSVAASQLPNPSASTLGGIQSFAAQSNKWINTISTSGVPSATQPAFTDISGSLSSGQLPSGIVATTTGTFANLPGSPSTGQQYLFNDSIYDSAFYDGSAWHYRMRGYDMTPPVDGSFTWQNQGTATKTTTNGGVRLVSPLGAGSHSMNGRYIAYPTAPFTITLVMKSTLWGTSTGPIGSSSGIYLSDGTKVLGFGVGTFASSGANIIYQSGATVAFSANVASYKGPICDTYWIRLDDGVTSSGKRTWWISCDGTFPAGTYIYQEVNTTFLTSTRLGFYVDGYDTGDYQSMWAASWQ